MSNDEWNEIVAGLRDVDDTTRSSSAAERLHRTAAPEDLARLLSLLNDDDFVVREAAAWPISELAGPSALRELLVAYQRGFDYEQDNDGFTTALMDLAESNPASCRKVLEGLAKDADPATRENAAWLLDFC
jgi:HEAT repeat protein